jgi:hypothetical protein
MPRAGFEPAIPMFVTKKKREREREEEEEEEKKN